MIKNELIAVVAASTQQTKAVVEEILETAFLVACAEIKQGNDAILPGFGKFDATQKAARMGRNPKTGEAVEIAARTSPRFKASKRFKDVLN